MLTCRAGSTSFLVPTDAHLLVSTAFCTARLSEGRLDGGWDHRSSRDGADSGLAKAMRDPGSGGWPGSGYPSGSRMASWSGPHLHQQGPGGFLRGVGGPRGELQRRGEEESVQGLRGHGQRRGRQGVTRMSDGLWKGCSKRRWLQGEDWTGPHDGVSAMQGSRIHFKPCCY